jgi:hypothetical protein|tara:strand:+ start:1425 stop:1697 length:273 start_codon:yes stop_codon:yes gene_type:complete
MANEETQVEETQVEAAADAEQEPVNITIADLQGLVNLIDVASSRGAFRGAELSAVGTLYTKLATFLQQILGTQQAEVNPDSPVDDGSDAS